MIKVKCISNSGNENLEVGEWYMADDMMRSAKYYIYIPINGFHEPVGMYDKWMFRTAEEERNRIIELILG